LKSLEALLPVPSRCLVQFGASFTSKPDRLLIASERHATWRVPFPRRRRPISFAVEADERSNVEATGIEWALSTEPWRYRRRRDRGILASWSRPLKPRFSPKRLR
jgi:hypothetical protein